MFWDQQMSYEPQDRRSDERMIETFINIMRAKVVGRGRRAIHDDPDYITSYETMSSPLRHEVMIRSTDTHTLEIDNDRMTQVVEAIERLDKAERDARSAQALIEEINDENNDFHTFMAQNPELREQYRELMTMCKLAGLRKIPSKLR